MPCEILKCFKIIKVLENLVKYLEIFLKLGNPINPLKSFNLLAFLWNSKTIYIVGNFPKFFLILETLEIQVNSLNFYHRKL